MDDKSMARDRKGSRRAYGQHLAECLGVQEPPVHTHRAVRRGPLAISELNAPIGSPHPSASLGYDDAYIVAVQLKSFQREFWLNGRSVACDPVQAGMTYLYDLRQDPRVLVRDPAHTITFYLPRMTLDAIAEQNARQAIADLGHLTATGLDDAVLRHLGQAALAAFAEPHKSSGLLLDGIIDTACVHLLGRYGEPGSNSRQYAARLAPWQLRRAKEMMNDRLDVSLGELADACGISVSQFGRAFKQTTGLSPHRWQLGRRMDMARTLLSGSTHSIAEIALACAFSSQSHLSTAFKEETGISPGRWRRLHAPRLDFPDPVDLDRLDGSLDQSRRRRR